mgnify:CR=1 FL=1
MGTRWSTFVEEACSNLRHLVTPEVIDRLKDAAVVLVTYNSDYDQRDDPPTDLKSKDDLLVRILGLYVHHPSVPDCVASLQDTYLPPSHTRMMILAEQLHARFERAS